jgi:copper homeostasis protein
MNRIRLEVCVDDAPGLDAAIAGGADRIELCSSLALGGLTPSPGLMRLASQSPVPVRAMIRPRPGDFVFSERDVETMLADIGAARLAGLDGVVLGVSLPDNRLDEEALGRLADAAGSMGRTLHRAIDLAPDPEAALDTAMALGFDCVLTSGSAPNVADGIATIGRLVARAGNRIVVMAGGGLRNGSIAPLADVGVRWMHASGGISRAERDTITAFGFGASERRITDAATVRALRETLDAFD